MPRPTKPLNTVPIPPISPMDTRPAVCDLLKKYSDDIDFIRKKVSENNSLYNSDYHDDLWLLRFLLSHKKTSKAAKLALRTMEYRSKYGLDAQDQLGWLAPPAPGESVPKIFTAYDDRSEKGSVYHTQSHCDGGIIVYVRTAGIDMNRMSKEVTAEDMRATLRVTNEFYFRVLDEVTRRTGRLTKMVRLFDMEGMVVGRLNRSFVTLEGQVSKEIEYFYPQMLSAVSVFNVPKVLESAWTMLKYLCPARTREKVEMFATLDNDSLPKDSRIFQHISQSNLPKKYGGKSLQWPPVGYDGPPEGGEFIGGLQTYHALDIGLSCREQ